MKVKSVVRTFEVSFNHEAGHKLRLKVKAGNRVDAISYATKIALLMSTEFNFCRCNARGSSVIIANKG